MYKLKHVYMQNHLIVILLQIKYYRGTAILRIAVLNWTVVNQRDLRADHHLGMAAVWSVCHLHVQTQL